MRFHELALLTPRLSGSAATDAAKKKRHMSRPSLYTVSLRMGPPQPVRTPSLHQRRPNRLTHTSFQGKRTSATATFGVPTRITSGPPGLQRRSIGPRFGLALGISPNTSAFRAAAVWPALNSEGHEPFTLRVETFQVAPWPGHIDVRLLGWLPETPGQPGRSSSRSWSGRKKDRTGARSTPWRA